MLSVFGMLIMVLDPLVDERGSQRLLGLIALTGSVAAIASALYQSQYPGLGFWGMVKVDAFSTFFHVLITAIAAVAILSSYEYMEVQRIRAGEYYALVLFGAVGMCLMSSAVELVLIFIALEISSISTYVLAGFRRRAAISSEASLKYFLLGSFATAFFLYGVALMFGATGSTSIAVIGESLRSEPDSAAGLCRCGLHVRRAGFQSGRRSVSCVDAGRVRRRAGAGGRLHVHRPQGGGVCRAAASDV